MRMVMRKFLMRVRMAVHTTEAILMCVVVMPIRVRVGMVMGNRPVYVLVNMIF